VDAEPATWDDVIAQPGGAADFTIAYGQNRDQFGELRLPDHPGSHPIVMLIHGGCWLPEFNLVHIRPLAEAITRLGLATWTIEYRRPAEAQDGWPGTFEDVASALDLLTSLAVAHDLDIERITLIGHSAGGQLALWLAARPSFGVSHPLFSPHPLAINRVLALAPIADMVTYGHSEGSCPAGARRVMGGAPETHPGRYRAVSPLSNLALDVQVDVVHALNDSIVPVTQSETYVGRVNESGGQATLYRLPPPAGHFDVLISQGPVWKLLHQLLLRAP